MIHFEPLVDTLRLFRGGRQYGDPYDAVATVVICGDLAYLGAMHGRVSRADRADLRAELLRRGVVDLLIVRRGARVWYDVETGQRERGRFPGR